MTQNPGNPAATEASAQAALETAASAAAQSFIARWQGVTASELSTSQSFVRELCELLGVEVPHPTPDQSYMFERPITFAHGDGSTSAGRVDCYKRGHFVWESKKLKAGVAAQATGSAQHWPSTLPEQVRALAQLLSTSPAPMPLPAIEASFKGKGPWKKGLPRILETLEALGRAHFEGAGWRG